MAPSAGAISSGNTARAGGTSWRSEMSSYKDGSVYFTLDCEGHEETCRVSGIALLDIEGILERDVSDSEFVEIFEKYRALIQNIAVEKIYRNDRSYGGVFVMTSDLN